MISFASFFLVLEFVFVLANTRLMAATTLVPSLGLVFLRVDALFVGGNGTSFHVTSFDNNQSSKIAVGSQLVELSYVGYFVRSRVQAAKIQLLSGSKVSPSRY